MAHPSVFTVRIDCVARHDARIAMHLPAGWTRVIIERAGRDVGELDVPTDAVPRHLRGIGPRFIIATQTVTPEAGGRPRGPERRPADRGARAREPLMGVRFSPAKTRLAVSTRPQAACSCAP